MSSKIKIITVNLDKDKTEGLTLGIRDMQDLLDQGWSIAGQSQYQNAVTYTFVLHEIMVSTDIDSGASQVPVSIPLEYREMNNPTGKVVQVLH